MLFNCDIGKHALASRGWARLVLAAGTLLGIAGLSGCGSLAGTSDLLGYGKPGITSGIDDVQTDVSFLDSYKPVHATPSSIVPRGPDGTLLALPGLWEGTFWSYCLHAGVLRPKEGNGYAYTPLKGPDAPIIRHILQHQLAHPEIEQEKIQSLIWAILARTRLSDSTPEIKATAQALLSRDEIDQLNGGALGKIPPQLLERILAALPPELREAARVNGQLRELLQNPANVPYEQLERIAAPLGDIPAPAGSRNIGVGRWSYDESQRLFVRYFPDGYQSTRIQFYAPQTFTVERDQSGRISAIADHGGTRIDITYKAESSLGPMKGDPGVSINAFETIRLTTPDPEQPWESGKHALAGNGWVLVGIPNGAGKAIGEGSALLQQRYDGAYDLTRQVSKLGEAIRKRTPAHAALDASHLVELGSYAAALESMYDAKRGPDEWTARGLDLFYRAWMSEVALAGQTAGFASTRATGRELAMFDPSGEAAQPGNSGMQRLGESPRDDQCKNLEEKKKQVERDTKILSWGATGFEIAMEGLPAPSWFPEGPFEEFKLDFDIDTGFRMAAALAGCPPSASAHLNMAPQVNVPLAVPAQPPSAQSAKAFHEFVGAWQRLSSQLQKAVASQEQYRVALAARDKVAADARARELADNLRASGVEMLQTSARLSALSTQLRSEHWDVPLTLEGIRKYQENLKANGFPKDVLEAVKKHGLSDEDIQAVYTRRLQPLTDWQDTTQLRVFDDEAAALQELGRLYAALPAVS